MAATPLHRSLRILGVLAVLPIVLAGTPKTEEAQAFAEDWLQVVAEGKADLRYLEKTVSPAGLESLPPNAGRQYYRELALKLGEGAPLRLTLDEVPEVLAVSQGPDYVRVVLSTEPALTLKVREIGDELVIDAIERSVCVVCTEEERFVATLISDAGRSGGRPLLVAGVDLLVAPEEESRQPDEWVSALQQRNASCGFGRALLHDAEVLGSDNHGVTVALADRTETWPVVYVDGRYMLDYSGLPEDSPLRLPDKDLGRWHKRAVVEQERLRNWYPVMEPRLGGTVIADEVLWFDLRPVQGDLVLYSHDLSRVLAMAVTLDPETGEVAQRLSLPTLDRTLMVEPERWNEAFFGALSPDGEQIAVGSSGRLWTVPLDGGKVKTNLSFAMVQAVAWSPDGRWIAVGDHRGVSLIDAETQGERGRYWGEGAGLVEALAFGEDSLWVVHDDGRVEELEVPSLAKTGRTTEACCGGVRGGELDPSTGELVVGCSGECQPAWMWSWDGQSDPMVRADEEHRSDRGIVSVDPLGRYLVSPTVDGRAALWLRRTDEVLGVFGEAPLVRVAWDPRGELLYGLDDQGRLWRWGLSSLF